MSSHPAPPPPPHRQDEANRRANRLVAAAISALQGLVLLGWCVFYAVEIVQGKSDQVDRAIMSVALIGVFAVALLMLARAWRQPEVDWPRTPTIVWNLLLLPVAWTMWTSHQPWLALAVGVGSLVAVVAAARAGTHEDPADDPDRVM